MNAIFHEHIRKSVECYIDDITVKSYVKGDHIVDLKIVFDTMRAHQLKMNPTKFFLGVANGKIPWVCRDIQSNPPRPKESLRHPRDATSKEP